MNVTAEPGTGHGRVLLPWRSILLVVVAIAAYAVFGAAPGAWVFDRAEVAQGEWWRLLSGHWVHSDTAHAAWDIAALLIIGAIFESRLRWRLPVILIFVTVGVDTWLWWGDPDLRYYCGLSGILNGLLIVGLVYLWRDTRHPVALLTGIAAVLKIALEITSGQSLITQTAWPSVPSAHAAGILSGLVFVIGAWISGYIRKRLRNTWPARTARWFKLTSATLRT